MCGIVAQHGSVDEAACRRMLGRLEHRGPDDEGTARVAGGWLGHRRLSIVDLESGAQPLTTPDEGAAMVGNGEIYNHERVRARLGDRPYATGSDNEAALHAILARGDEGLRELEGMYAVVVATRDGGFLAARDPVGIKPLYWAERDGAVTFASELKAFEPRMRPAVRAFPPGHAWTPRGGLRQFAAPAEAPACAAPRDREELLAAIRDTLVRAVEDQMMGDVPVGVFLSGGLDSSIVAAIAARWCRAHGTRLQTFAVGVGRSSDLLAARAVARHLDTDHHEATCSPEETAALVPEVVRTIEHFDPELVRSAVPNFLLARHTAAHVKVVLTGEGADELFAGYDHVGEISDPEALHGELTRSVAGLHNLNLQRCDRVTMAHGLEARVPFLDERVIALALGIDPALKLRREGEMEKQLLREAFDGWLPADVLWRRKVQFGDGSGSAAVLRSAPGEAEPPAAVGGRVPRTREEERYLRVWDAAYGGIDPDATLSHSVTC